MYAIAKLLSVSVEKITTFLTDEICRVIMTRVNVKKGEFATDYSYCALLQHTHNFSIISRAPA